MFSYAGKIGKRLIDLPKILQKEYNKRQVHSTVRKVTQNVISLYIFRNLETG